MDDRFVAVDMGGTRTRAALCSAAGVILDQAENPTPARQGAEALLENLVKTIRKIWPRDGKVRAIGVAVPGPLDPWKGVILYSPNLPGWEGFPLKNALQKRFGVEVRVNDDGNAGALGEQRFGAGRGKKDIVYLTIGTGVGSGIIVGNRLLQGSRGVAGEAGHMILASSAPIVCGCGRRGCLESLISGPSLAEQARLGLRGDNPSMTLVLAGGDLAAIEGKTVTEAATLGDPMSRRILNKAGVYLGLAIINLMLIFDPEIVIVGGSVSKAGELLLEPARETVRRHGLASCWKGTTVVLAGSGENAGLLGAFSLVAPS